MERSMRQLTVISRRARLDFANTRNILAAPPLARHLDQLQSKANQGKSRNFKMGIHKEPTSVGSAASSLSSSPPQAPNFRRTLLEGRSIDVCVMDPRSRGTQTPPQALMTLASRASEERRYTGTALPFTFFCGRVTDHTSYSS